MTPQRSEPSYIVHDIIPQFEEFGYPRVGDSERVKINEVPVYRPSGGRSGSSMDIVYYHNGEPLLLVEAKRTHRTHKQALREAKIYLKNFPTDDLDYALSGKAPFFIATTVGREIRFYRHWFDTEEGQLVQQVKEIDTLTFEELIAEYGLEPEFVPQKLTQQDFREKFLNELLAIFALDKEEGITPEVIKNIAWLILTYLRFPRNYTNQSPYIDLREHPDRQRHIRDLFRRYAVEESLGKDLAFEFRDFILRAFQGSKELNQYLTPQSVVAFMCNLCEISSEDKVLDFECGSGGFIAAAVSQDVPIENVLGIDIADLPYYVAKTYLALYFGIGGEEIESIPIKTDNGLYFWGDGWSVVIGNPAGGNKYDPEGELDDLEKVLENLEKDLDRDGRDDRFSEYNFSIQQAVRSCKVGGKICLVLPEGFFANPTDEFLRKYVAKYCKIKVIISLPRGVFKKGTTTRTVKSGSQASTQKMSILFAKKVRKVEDNTGLEIDFDSLDYPVFLASIQKPENVGQDPDDWLEPLLRVVLKEWQSWDQEKSLSDEETVLDTKVSGPKKKPEKLIKPQKAYQEQLIKWSGPLFDQAEKEKQKPKTEKKTLIPKILEGLFKK